jgi:hypothetical protein
LVEPTSLFAGRFCGRFAAPASFVGGGALILFDLLDRVASERSQNGGQMKAHKATNFYVWYPLVVIPRLDGAFTGTTGPGDILCGRQLIKLSFDALYGRAR